MSYSTTASQLAKKSQFSDFSANFGTGFPFFGFQMGTSYDKTKTQYNMLDYFENFTMSMDILPVGFSRPFFNIKVLYGMEDTFVSGVPKGEYSTGLPYGKLEGTCALIPTQAILARNIKTSYSKRVRTTHEEFDRALFKASTGVRLGPFTLFGGSVENQVSTTMSNDKLNVTSMDIKREGLCIAGYICEALPLFPKVAIPQNLMRLASSSNVNLARVTGTSPQVMQSEAKQLKQRFPELCYKTYAHDEIVLEGPMQDGKQCQVTMRQDECHYQAKTLADGEVHYENYTCKVDV